MMRTPAHINLRLLGGILGLPGGRWVVGIGLFLLLAGVFRMSGALRPVEGSNTFNVALFFCFMVAYLVPVFHFVSSRTTRALDELSAWLTAPPDTVRRWRRDIARKPRRWLAAYIALGGLGGVSHLLLLYGPNWRGMIDGFDPVESSINLGTVLVWIVNTLTVSALVHNAVLFARVARNIRIDPLHSRRLRPFADAAIYPTLVVMGILTLFPLLLLSEFTSPMAYVPGLIATAGPLLLIAFLPVWPIHRRMADAKRRALQTLDSKISTLPEPDLQRPETLSALAPLLTYRRELLEAQEWPFDLGNLARLLLYIIIPPLTWVGAALIEQIVEAAL